MNAEELERAAEGAAKDSEDEGNDEDVGEMAEQRAQNLRPFLEDQQAKLQRKHDEETRKIAERRKEQLRQRVEAQQAILRQEYEEETRILLEAEQARYQREI